MIEMETSINGECAKSDIEEWLVRGSYFTDDYWWQSESINQKASTGKHQPKSIILLDISHSC